MEPKFEVQHNAKGVWKSLYNGNDLEKAKKVYYYALENFNTDDLRVLRSDEKNKDGSYKWKITEIPKTIELDLEPEPEPEQEIQPKSFYMRWFDSIVDKLYISLDYNVPEGVIRFVTGSVILVITFITLFFPIFFGAMHLSAPPNTNQQRQVTSSNNSNIETPSLPSLENTLMRYMSGNASPSSMIVALKLTNIILKETNRIGAIGGKIENQESRTIEIGTLLFNGRRMPAGIVEVKNNMVFRRQGLRGTICARMAGAIDEEFQLVREITFLPCSNYNADYLEWARSSNYTKSN